MKNSSPFSQRMNVMKPPLRRIVVLLRIFNKEPFIRASYTSASSNNAQYHGESLVKIGDISKVVKHAKNPMYVPSKYALGEISQDTLKHLRWMLQKDLLGQDMFLIGRPGPLRRKLAMQFLEITDRELEFVSLSRDTTEADLKQRREIKNGTAIYFDQSAVRAAVEGRILVLEGIEKAERNVLPVLNNLLENREMHLEDGRFLIPAKRYDNLLKEHGKEELDKWKLVRVSEDFRVIALGIPVPRYIGNPLDPPLRSRFQARDIGRLNYKEQLESLRQLAPSLDPARLSQLLSSSQALLTSESSGLPLPDFPIDNLPAAAQILESFPESTIYEVFYRLYPYRSFLSPEGQNAVETALSTFQISKNESNRDSKSVQNIKHNDCIAEVTLSSRYSGSSIQLPCGLESGNMKSNEYIATAYQDELLANLMLSHQYSDICLIGSKGCGKSSTVLQLARMLNYVVEPIVLYQDMTSRDLLQQRTTLTNGDTVWRNSPLVTAALEGKLAILDGIHRVHQSTLTVVHRLIHDRELTLYDGTRLLRHDRYDSLKQKHNLTDEQMKALGILKIHPSFRIIGLAEPPVQGNNQTQWLSPEMLSLFLYHEMRPLRPEEEISLIQNLYGDAGSAVKKVMQVAHEMKESQDPSVRTLSGSLSTRQLLRIAKRMKAYPDSPANAIQRACLSRFLPTLSQQTLNRCLSDAGLDMTSQESLSESVCKIDGDNVIIGKTMAPRYKTEMTTKIPDILFFDVPQHIAVLERLLQDFCLGEHLLLIGNQGVGKNKLADRLLQLLNRPREYIQLHRDTTVQTLTLQPTVRDGVVIYEDSPLVKAVKSGHVLIVDEADKAPTHVTCILKTLVESGEMILSDGRRIVPLNYPQLASAGENLIPIHKDFRMIVLANRPGFPFLGNDFFGALGDLFSCHAVDNPSAESEHSLLKQYGPDVPDKVIMRLVKAFAELRVMADQGLLQYPYSTREVVNIVKHLQEFPNESLSNIVGNVFDFDMYSQEVKDTLTDILNKHGIPVKNNANKIILGKEFSLPSLQLAGEWKTSADPFNVLPVEERFLKPTPAAFLRKNSHLLDITEARGNIFSEMQSYWFVPIGETGIIADIAVCQSPDNDPLKDWIHVLAINPPTLYSMQPLGKDIHELALESLIKPVQGKKPSYKVFPGKFGENIVIIHEQTSNGLYLVEPEAGSACKVPITSSFFQEATRSFAETISRGSKLKSWKLLPELLNENNFIVLFENGGNTIDAINIETMTAYSLSLPLQLKHVYTSSVDRWLIEDVENRKYLMTKFKPSDPIPSALKHINDNPSALLESLVSCGTTQLSTSLIGEALNQKINSPNRLFTSKYSSAIIAVGFPDLDFSNYQFYAWPRIHSKLTEGSLDKTICLPGSGLIIRPVTCYDLPEEMVEEKQGDNKYLEVTDIARHKIRFIPIPETTDVSSLRSWILTRNEIPVFIAPTSNQGLATVDSAGCVRLWEVEVEHISKSLNEWKHMIGSEREDIQLTIERPSGLDVSAPKHGKVDEKGDPHVGGNTWAGGTGGRDTAGLGGKGGPYRLDGGHNVHQVSQEEKDAVPEHVKKAAHEMARKAFKQRLKEIKMSEYDAKVYESFSNSVSKQVQALRVVLSSLQAKSKERTWLRHQTSGELDDTKLIEGLTGEKSIYRRRAEKEPELGTPQTKPKRLRLIVDVSGSMYRFNGYDGRLDREMEVVVMVMEAFQGFEREIQYDIAGHSGEDIYVNFVDHKKPPADNKERLDIIKTMCAHSQYCMSGDHTLTAIHHGINELSQEDCDEALLVALSDANLQRYGISPENLARTLTLQQNVNAYAVFIGSLGDEAARLTKRMPAGRGFLCLDLTKLPQILQQIFSSSVVK